MRKLLASLSLAIALAGCASAPSGPVEVRLIAFNDLHGHLEAAPGLTLAWPDPAQPERALRLNAGGAAYLAGTVQALRAGARHSLVLSSGDLIGATPLISALFLHESTIDVMNRLGLDIAAPGNHEFDAGRAEFERVIGGGCRAPDAGAATVSCALEHHAGARFEHVAANIVTERGRTLLAPSTVREFDGVRVGFIGAVTRATPRLVSPSGVVGLRFTDEAEAINAEAARLKAQGVEALVVLIHEGGEIGNQGTAAGWNDTACDNRRGPVFEIARRLSRDIDLVFSAHTHQGYRCVVDGLPILQATAHGRGVSVADLVIDRKSGDVDRTRSRHRNLPVFNSRSDPALRAMIVAAEPAPFDAALREAQPVAAVAQRVAQYAAAAAPLAQRVVGRIGGNFERAAATDASAGRLIADAQWLATRAPERGGAQFALMNPGGVRTDLRCAGAPPCEVTYGDVFTMQPFGNSLVVMTLSGVELKRLLEDQQRPGRAAPLFLIPSASLTYRWQASAPHGQRVQELRIGGAPWRADDNYRFTVNSFLAEGGDGMSILAQGRDRVGAGPDLEALIAHLASVPAPDPTPRITLVP